MPYATHGPTTVFKRGDAVALAMMLGTATVLGVLALCVLVISESDGG